VSGQGAVPATVVGGILNVTATGYSSLGWLTLFPGAGSRPATSTLNFDRAEYAIANSAVARLGNGGQACANAGNTASQVIVDVTGGLSNTGFFLIPLLLSPQRLVDTRSNGGPIPANASRCFAVAGQAGIPADAAGALLNVTAVGQSGRGWLTVFPNGQPVPSTSSLNYDNVEYAIANGVVARIGAGGQVCVQAGSASSNVILDASGYLIP
jgi:hypothetical protein